MGDEKFCCKPKVEKQLKSVRILGLARQILQKGGFSPFPIRLPLYTYSCRSKLRSESFFENPVKVKVKLIRLEKVKKLSKRETKR